MSYGALSLSQSDLQQTLKYLISVQNGKAALNPKVTSKSDYGSLVPLKNFLHQGSPADQTSEGMAEVMRVRSTYRDVPYALAGRRYLQTNGINRQILAIKHRMS